VVPLGNSEVGKALYQMGPDKAPGLDGLTIRFMQQHCDVMGV
jgi:hypothetical protein